MPKYFPRTNDGDQISVEFEYKEELDAFRAGMIKLHLMRDALRHMDPSSDFDVKHEEKPWPMNVATLKEGNVFLTSLEVEALNHHKSAVTKILGVHVCNIFGRSSIHMSNCTG